MFVNRTQRRVLLVVALSLMAGGIAAGAAPPAASLRGAMEDAVRVLLADLFTERPAGTVVSIQASGDLIAKFPGAAPPPDAEYLVARPPTPGGLDFAQTVGAVRIAEAKGEIARAVVLWSGTTLQAGDQLVWPPRITILLQPTEAGDAPDLADLARRLDRWIELELLTDRRLRVVRADQPAEERWRLKRFQEEREYGLTVAPLLVSGTAGVEVILRVRSLYTGQTLAQRQALWKTVLTQPAPPPATAPVPARPVPSPAPYGPAIRPVEPPKAIQRAERSADHLTVPLPHTLNAVALGDVDGDGRPEVIGITDRQVIVSRWTGRDLVPLATGDLLPAFTTYLYVDAGDINGNGRDEIILTAVRSVPRHNQMENSLLSVIAEVGKGRIEPLVTYTDKYLRVFKRPGQRPFLLAQKLGTHELFDGPVEVIEWTNGRFQLGVPHSLPRSVSSLYGFGMGDLDSDGRAELALVASDGRLRIYDEQGQLRWEGEEDLGVVEATGFAQTPRHPDYRGRGFDATAEQLAVWRSVPRRVLVVLGPTKGPDLVTVGNPRGSGLQVSFGKQEVIRGRVFGYGWDSEVRRFAKRWESADLSSQALDLAIGDLGGEGRVQLVVLSGVGAKRSLDIYTLFDRPQPTPAVERR